MLERSVERDTEKERAMARTVALFNAAFPATAPMTEYQGWMFMLFLKMARAHGGKFREDDYLDMAAYSALAGECRGEDQPKPDSLAGIDFAEMERRVMGQSHPLREMGTNQNAHLGARDSQ
jgi:hypothetical protein